MGVGAVERQGTFKRQNIRYEGVAAIAPWFCQRLPFCGPGFQSPTHHLRFFQFILS